MKIMKRIFSGVKPSGNLHIGNYIGAIKQWVERQKEADCFFCIVDLHAITVPQNPKILREKIRELTALYLACGIDPEKSTVFVQSHNPDHASLAWILDCFTSMGQLSRMTQYKSKSNKQDLVSVGLFNYPVLMAADILLYDADEVPVGDDQKQHVELTRDIAQRFNSRFGKVLKVPEVKMFKMGARIMSLQDPLEKMSKSDQDKNGVVDLLDKKEEIARKIKSAVTDSGKEIVFRENKPAIANLMTIHSHFSGLSVREIEERYQGKGYVDLKKDLAEIAVDYLAKIQEKYFRIREDEKFLNQILEKGCLKAKKVSQEILERVYQAVGLG